MIRKKQFIEAGMCNINLPARQDWDLWIRLSKLGNAHVINNCFTLYRIHDNQISSGVNRKLEGFSQLLSYHKKYFFNKKAISAFHFHLFKLILLQKISKIKSDRYNEVLKENNTAAKIISFLVLILIYTPLINKFLINKLIAFETLFLLSKKISLHIISLDAAILEKSLKPPALYLIKSYFCFFSKSCADFTKLYAIKCGK